MNFAEFPVYLHAPDFDLLEEHDGRLGRDARMNLLLTSAGITSPSIGKALVDLLGKPIADSSALCIPTAQYGHPMCGPDAAGASSPAGLGCRCVIWDRSRSASWSSLRFRIGDERWVSWGRATPGRTAHRHRNDRPQQRRAHHDP